MVIGILESHLDGVVVHIADGKLVAHMIKPKRLELKVCHRAGGILGESLVYVYVNACSGFQFSAFKVRRKNLICNTKSHISLRHSIILIFIPF